MNSKELLFIFMLLGLPQVVKSQTPNLEAVTTQGSTTTNSIALWSQDGMGIVSDSVNATLRVHSLKGSPVDPGVLRFDCGSRDVTSGWEFYNSNEKKSLMYIRQNSGSIGIGTTTPKTKLAVNGDAMAKKVRITPFIWADFVFENSYQLPSLLRLEHFISQYKHLPEIPSAKEVSENDLDLGQNGARLLQKVEEMTLYLIAQEKELEKREQSINEKQRMLADRERRLLELEASVENK